MCQRGVYKWVDRFRRGCTSDVITETERSTEKIDFYNPAKNIIL
jgi:hypothetical protein